MTHFGAKIKDSSAFIKVQKRKSKF